MSIWALLGFRIQLYDWLNSIIDKNENKHPHPLVKYIRYQGFPVYGFDMNLNVNETIRYQTCKMKMLEIK